MYDFPTITLRARGVPANDVLSHTEIRKAAAARAFWSDHPLNVAFRTKSGKQTFSLKEFSEFVVAMPGDEFAACMFSA